MSEAVITAEGLSKRYLVAHSAENQGHRRYLALRDVIGREIRNIARKSRQSRPCRRRHGANNERIDWLDLFNRSLQKYSQSEGSTTN